MSTAANYDRVDFPAVLNAVTMGEHLTREQTGAIMASIVSGESTPTLISAFMTAMRCKGETVDEVLGLLDAMMQYAVPFGGGEGALDIVGTGGDMERTVNISTMAALVCAGAGQRVVKHGSRSASSSTGTVDVLEALGLDMSVQPEPLAQVAADSPIVLLFAQLFHPGMRHGAGVRKEIKIPTVFNLLGPLANPAQPTYSMIGVARADAAPFMAGILAARGRRGAVVRGQDGLDEVTLSQPSSVWWVGDGGDPVELELTPEAVGVQRAPISALRGAGPAHNAQVVRDLLDGATGPIRDAVVINAGLALALCDEPVVTSNDELADVVRTGMVRASQALDDGSAATALRTWRDATLTHGKQDNWRESDAYPIAPASAD